MNIETALLTLASPTLDVLFGREDKSLDGYTPIADPPPPPSWTGDWPPDA